MSMARIHGLGTLYDPYVKPSYPVILEGPALFADVARIVGPPLVTRTAGASWYTPLITPGDFFTNAAFGPGVTPQSEAYRIYSSGTVEAAHLAGCKTHDGPCWPVGCETFGVGQTGDFTPLLGRQMFVATNGYLTTTALYYRAADDLNGVVNRLRLTYTPGSWGLDVWPRSWNIYFKLDPDGTAAGFWLGSAAIAETEATYAVVGVPRGTGDPGVLHVKWAGTTNWW